MKEIKYNELSTTDADTISLIIKKYLEQGMEETNLFSMFKTDNYEKTTQEIVDNVRVSFIKQLDALLNEYRKIMNYRNKIITELNMAVIDLDTNSVLY